VPNSFKTNDVLQRLAELFPTGKHRIVAKGGGMVFTEDTTTLADLFDEPVALLDVAEQLLVVLIGYPCSMTRPSGPSASRARRVLLRRPRGTTQSQCGRPRRQRRVPQLPRSSHRPPDCRQAITPTTVHGTHPFHLSWRCHIVVTLDLDHRQIQHNCRSET
jgi:hypothetical protein